MAELEDIISGLAHCKNDNQLGALNCGYCPYDKYKDKDDISPCTSKLCHDAYELLKELKRKGKLKL